jgi:hypothetical protein
MDSNGGIGDFGGIADRIDNIEALRAICTGG